MLSQVSMGQDTVTDMRPAVPCPLLTAASPFRQIPQAAASMKEGKWDRKKVGAASWAGQGNRGPCRVHLLSLHFAP